MNPPTSLAANDLHQAGIDAFVSGQLDLAIQQLQNAVSADGNNPNIRVNLAIALNHAQRHAVALLHLDQAIAMAPQLAMAHFQKAISLQAIDHCSAALASIECALQLQPNDPLALSLRAQLLSTSDPQAALEDYRRIAELAPSAESFFNVGCAWQRLGLDEQALQAFDEALRHDPNFFEALCNKGNVLRDLGQPHQALACYLQAQQQQAHHPSLLWNMSLVFLQLGDYSNGWPLYEYRWPTAEQPHRVWPGPRLTQLENLSNKTILVLGEQGLGDVIQFCRYLPLLANKGARLIVQAPKTLHSLIATMAGVDRLIDLSEDLPACDFHCPMMSLPLLFQTQVATIPFTDRAYLKVDESTLTKWREKLGEHSPHRFRKRIGLVVRGQSRNPREHLRSVGLAAMLPFLPKQHDYVLLHPSLHEEDQQALVQAHHVRHFAGELDSMQDTAALCQLMDLVISVDTSVAHLSGALGRPTWVMLALASDWRWLLERTDSPWYRSVELLRQTQQHDWSDVLQQLFNQLSD